MTLGQQATHGHPDLVVLALHHAVDVLHQGIDDVSDVTLHREECTRAHLLTSRDGQVLIKDRRGFVAPLLFIPRLSSESICRLARSPPMNGAPRRCPDRLRCTSWPAPTLRHCGGARGRAW